MLQAGSSSFTYTYDANGNAITRNGFTLAWNKSNYPTSIAGSGETASFFYDGNNQRWKQVYVNGSITETTIYVGDDLEKVTTGSTVDWRHYIKAGDQTIAVYSRQSAGTNTFRYLLDDQQGSIAKITDSAGATYVSESFSAFGNRRNPATWSGAPTAGDVTNINAVSREGYTGQDFIGSLGLNHMNGRVQDAITGRFLSADPYITEPGNTQNYNRYSYVYNNPLSYTDPSGFAAAVVCSDGATVMCITVDLDEIVVGFHLDKSDFLNRQWSADVTQDMLKGFVPIFNYQAPSNADTAPHTGAIPEITVTARRKQEKKPTGNVDVNGNWVGPNEPGMTNLLDEALLYVSPVGPELAGVKILGVVGKNVAGKLAKQIAKIERQLSEQGRASFERSLKSLQARRLEEYGNRETYRSRGGPTSSVDREIQAFDREIEAIQEVLGRTP